MPERALKVPEVQERLGNASRYSTYGLIASGAIRSVRLGTGRNAPIRVPESAVDEFLSGLKPGSLIASLGADPS
jgi:predicted DNA-binding transcriptional regulator AlpA